MIGRAVLFLVLGAVEGAMLGAVSVRALVSTGGAGTSFTGAQEAAAYWALIGALHGIVLFSASLGKTPVIEDTRRGRFVASGLARGFDLSRFGHRIPYIAISFGLIVAFAVAPLLAQQANVEVTSVGVRLAAGVILCLVWTGVAMFLNTIIVSKIALTWSIDADRAAARLKGRSVDLFQRGMITTAIKKGEEALHIFQATRYDRAHIATHIALGRMYISNRQVERAMKHLTVACEDSQKTGYEQAALESAELLGECLLQQGRSGEALSYFQSAVALEDKENRGFKALHKSVPMPVTPQHRDMMGYSCVEPRATVMRSPNEVALRRTRAALSRANVARAMLREGQPDGAASVLGESHSALVDALGKWQQEAWGVDGLPLTESDLDALSRVAKRELQQAADLEELCDTLLEARKWVDSTIRESTLRR